MILHWWVLPILGIAAACVVAFYISVRLTGGTGVRTNGRTLVHKPDDEDDALSH